MALTEIQRKALANKPAPKLLEYVEKGQATFPDDFTYVDDEKKAYVEQTLNSRPNPQEVDDWAAVIATPDAQAVNALINYMNRWSAIQPPQNHLEEAQQRLDEINSAREAADWGQVDAFNVDSLLGYLQKYPRSVHRSEIDDAVWGLLSNPVTMAGIARYLAAFPAGNHMAEAQKTQSEYAGWQTVKANRDLPTLVEYIRNNPQSPFINEANFLLQELKDQEIQNMRQMSSKYPSDRLIYFIEQNIFTENELIASGIVTQDSLVILRNLADVQAGLPDVMTEAQRCQKICSEGRTDVFLFGIPSTGKSCILMGLIGSPQIDVNYVRSGGPYAGALRQYLDAGCLIGQTPADFVATLEAEIPGKNINYHLNLVEMAGEDFAFKLAQNPDGHVSFRDMGAGAPQLLANGNRKAFFLIVDPTARTVTFNHIVEYVDPQGNRQSSIVLANVNQRITLKCMVDLFNDPENEEIMKRVDSIHVIVSKADMLGRPDERDQKAYDLFMSQYKTILAPLIRVCKKYDINRATNGCPKLYTFSLGDFYAGGIYQYDEIDSNKLVEVIRGNVSGEREATMFDRVRSFVNKPII